MLGKIVFYIKQKYLESKWCSENEWLKKYNLFYNFKQIDNKEWNSIVDKYYYYISNISTESMAISLETSRLLYYYLKNNRVQRILDFGSGFSSYLFRSIHENVITVDDDLNWLEKTKMFLNDNKVYDSDLYHLGENAWKELKYDFIFVDLNFIEERVKHIKLILTLTQENSVIIFDDVHKLNYLKELNKKLNTQKGYILNKITFDKFGRYALIYYP